MEPFDLVLLIVIGDLVQQGITQSDYSLVGLLVAPATIALLTVVVSYASFKFRRLRPVLEGEPVVILKAGKVIEQNLRRKRMTVEEVEAAARLQQIPSLEHVKWAVLETGGQISFLQEE
jgi:uncharacterized membrane protein YcaP (DUF421 family)